MYNSINLLSPKYIRSTRIFELISPQNYGAKLFTRKSVIDIKYCHSNTSLSKDRPGFITFHASYFICINKIGGA